MDALQEGRSLARAAMKERGILFSAPMVHAILDGRKTQTRRVLKSKSPLADCIPMRGEHHGRMWIGAKQVPLKEPGDALTFRCRYGAPGDRLWVRETGWEPCEPSLRALREGADTWPKYAYDADGISEQEAEDFKAWGWKRRPAIHMPRWASRITLELVRVRCQRLHEISAKDVAAEGVSGLTMAPKKVLVQRYAELWESINGPGSWDANPLVWALDFKRVESEEGITK